MNPAPRRRRVQRPRRAPRVPMCRTQLRRPRTPTISFVVAGKASDDVAKALTERAVFASHGDFYATTVIERIGQSQNGVVRAGCACYTSDEEVERLISAVQEVARA